MTEGKRHKLRVVVCLLILVFAAVLIVLKVSSRMINTSPRSEPLKEFQGNWRLLVEKANGVARTNNVGNTYAFRGSQLTIERISGKDPIALRVSIVPNGDPRQIDLTGEQGGQRIKLTGIYVLSKNRLNICVAPEFKQRPLEFETTDGDFHTVLELERIE